MFANITEKIVSNMEKQHMIQTDRRNIYKYGINQMLNMFLNIFTFLVIGLFFHMTAETVIFTAAYIPLRIYAGGFHAKTPFNCWIISALMLISVLVTMKYADISLFIYDVFAIISAVVILILSPVEDRNKPLDEVEKKIYKKRGLLVFAVELLLQVVLRFFQENTVSICIEMVWLELSIMLIAGKAKNSIIIKKKGEKHD